MRWLDALTGRSKVVGAALSPASPQFAIDTTTIDSGVLYGTPTLDDYIYGRVKISRDEALSVPAMKRARDLICGEIGQFPLLLLDPTGAPTDWSLLSQPEAGIARSVTLTRTVEDMLLYGRSWWRTTHVGWHGKPAEVRRLDPATVTVQPKYVTYPEGSVMVWPEIPGLIRIDSPNDGLLTSPAIRAYIALSRIAMRAVDNQPPAEWFTPAEGADPIVGVPQLDPVTGVMETQEEADARTIAEMMDDWSLARQQRLAAYIPAALKYNRDGFNPEQLQLMQAREFGVTEIARLTGIDAEELSVSTTSRTYFNGQDRRRNRIESVLGPYMTGLEGRLSMEDVTPRGYTTVLDTSRYLRLDDLAAAQTDQILIGAKVLLPDEAREKRNLEPLGNDAPAALPAAQEDSNA